MTESWWTDAASASSWFASPGARSDEDDGARPSFAIPAVLDLVVGELLDAVPELREHLLAAAGELLGAARAILDAAERVLEQQSR
jgi:hypothetical protein